MVMTECVCKGANIVFDQPWTIPEAIGELMISIIDDECFIRDQKVVGVM